MSGHCLAYPDSIAGECAATMPSADYAGREAIVCLQGPAGAIGKGSRLRKLGGNLPALRCTADPCVDWIRAGTFINPEYHRIRVHDPAAAAAQMNLLQSQLVGVDGASIIELPWDSAETECCCCCSFRYHTPG